MEINTGDFGGVWHFGKVVCQPIEYLIRDHPEITMKIGELLARSKQCKVSYRLEEGIICTVLKWVDSGLHTMVRPIPKQVIQAWVKGDKHGRLSLFVDENGLIQYIGLSPRYYTNQTYIPDVVRGYPAYERIVDLWERNIPRSRV